MKKVIVYSCVFLFILCWGCDKPNDLPPKNETFNDMDFVLPDAPRMSDAERDAIEAQKQAYEEAVANFRK